MMKTNNLTASLIGSVVVAVFMAAACGGSDSIAPSKSDPPAFTKAFVQQAIDRYDEEGRDATIAYYNTKESVDGEWYIFITDESDVTIARATASGQHRSEHSWPSRGGFYWLRLRCRHGGRHGRRHVGELCLLESGHG